MGIFRAQKSPEIHLDYHRGRTTAFVQVPFIRELPPVDKVWLVKSRNTLDIEEEEMDTP